MRLVAIPLLCVLVPMPAISDPKDCKEYARSRTPWYSLDEERCYCGAQLSNLTVTLPVGLRIEAVCGLRFDLRSESDGKMIHWIDLSREKVSLDKSTQGNYPEGLVYLSGTMEEAITGTVIVEEGPAGELWFHAKPNHDGPRFWEHHLKELDLGSDEDYVKLRAPRPAELQGECLRVEATAKIKIRDPFVLLGDTDEAGTGAFFDVIHVSKYVAACES